MQLAIRDSGVETNGVIGEETQFSIAVNPKMFKVLSDTMYQDKVGSIVREISCNAADAHIAAGFPEKPFEIHLPNAMEPWFSVRDMGIGLSDDDVRDMYTTYGESTKDTTNTMTGAFGLGSKTPFAYTDQFTVTSIFGGMKRVYVAVIQRGLPVLNLQDERPSDEHPGLEVHMGVRQGDYNEFAEAVLTQLKFFVIKPTLINNMSGIEFADVWNDDAITFQHELLTMFNGSWQSPVRGLTIVQGGVGYPVDISKVTGLPEDVKKFAEAIDSKGAFIEVEIGTISVTTNRESISYEENTVQGIIKTLTEISETMTRETVQEITDEVNLWDRCSAFNKQIPVLQDAIMVSVSDDLFKGASRGSNTKKIALKLDKLEAMDLKAIVIKKYEFRRRNYSSAQDWKLQRVETSSPDATQWYSSYNKHDGTLLYPNDDYIIVVKDTGSKPVARVKAYMEANNFPHLVMIEGHSRTATEISTTMIAKALSVDSSRVVKLSDWEAPKLTRSGAPSDRRPRGWKFPANSNRHSSNNYSSKDWIPVMDDLDDCGAAIWIGMERHDVCQTEDSRHVMELIRAGKITLPLIAVNQQTKKRIEDGKIGAELITPSEALVEIRKEVDAVKDEYIQSVQLREFCARITDMPLWKIRDKVNNRTLNIVADILDALAIVQVKLDATNMPLQNIIHASKEWEAGRARGEKVVEKLNKQFPMLRHIGGYWTDQDYEDAINYINLVQGA